MLATMPASAISVRELARVAGVSHAAPYRHFGDRAGFLGALTVLCFDEFVGLQQEAFDRSAPGQKLLAVGEAYVSYAQHNPFAFDLLYNTRTGVPLGDPAVQSVMLRHGELFQAALLDAEGAGMLPPHADLTSAGYAIWGAVHGLALLVTAGFAPPEGVADIFGSMLRAGTHAPPREPSAPWHPVTAVRPLSRPDGDPT